MQKIKKVLNSSVVLVVDEHDVERVVLGKGIGFGARPGEPVRADAVDQTFVELPAADRRDLVELMARIPGEFVDLTRAIVAAGQESGLQLDPHVYLALADHLHFAVERQRQGIVIVNKLVWEVRTVYPTQYAVGVRAVALARERLGVELPDEEAANVAFHLVNADVGHEGVDSVRIVQLIGQLTTIVEHSTGARLHGGDLHAARFVAHLQYFAERFFSGRFITSEDDFLFTSLSTRYPRAVASAERVRAFLRVEHDVELPNEEIAYLALHIARAAPA